MGKHLGVADERDTRGRRSAVRDRNHHLHKVLQKTTSRPREFQSVFLYSFFLYLTHTYLVSGKLFLFQNNLISITTDKTSQNC